MIAGRRRAFLFCGEFMNAANYLGFEQIISQYPCFSRGSLRRYLSQRKSNGLAKAVLQSKRKLIFHKPTFESWLQSYFQSNEFGTGANSGKYTPRKAKSRTTTSDTLVSADTSRLKL